MRCLPRRGGARPGAGVLFGLLVALAACAGPTRPRYEALSEEWRRSAPPSREAAAAEDDPFAGAAVLEREALVREVLARNPNARAARFAWRAALARYPQVTALDDPRVGVGAAPLSFGSDDVDDAWRFDLSQRLPAPGALRLRGEAALGEAEAAAHEWQTVRLRLATMASLLFDDYRLAKRSLAINAEHVGLLEEFRRIATARYETGEASQQDPIQAEVELTHAHHRMVLLETAYRVAAEQLNALLHRRADAPLPPPAEGEAPLPPDLAALGTRSAASVPAGAPDALPSIAVDEHGPPAPAVVATLVDEALAARPELAAAGARIAAQQARVGLAWGEILPDVTVAGAYNGVMQEEDLQPFVGLQLSVPLQIGRRRAAIDEARAALERVRSERLALSDEVRASVRTTALRLEEALHVARLFRDRLVPAARDQVDAARAGFETGRNSFLALIDAERNLLDVEIGLEEAIASRSRRRAELDRAVGRIPGLDGR